jgi:hypothetical protein
MDRVQSDNVAPVVTITLLFISRKLSLEGYWFNLDIPLKRVMDAMHESDTDKLYVYFTQLDPVSAERIFYRYISETKLTRVYKKRVSTPKRNKLYPLLRHQRMSRCRIHMGAIERKSGRGSADLALSLL